MAKPMHKTYAETGKPGGDLKKAGKSTPQSFKDGGSVKAEKKGNPFAKGKAKPFGKK